MILAPNEMKAAADDKKAGAACLEKVELDTNIFKLGHTKARKWPDSSFVQLDRFSLAACLYYSAPK